MKNILNKFHISIYTYLFIFLCFISGYIKNILIIFFICIIHEFGHLIFISLFKYKIKREIISNKTIINSNSLSLLEDKDLEGKELPVRKTLVLKEKKR